jgi:hypothetical protein
MTDLTALRTAARAVQIAAAPSVAEEDALAAECTNENVLALIERLDQLEGHGTEACDIADLRVLYAKASPPSWTHDGCTHYLEVPNAKHFARHVMNTSADTALVAAMHTQLPLLLNELESRRAEPIELAICESEHLRLRVGVTYRFVVMPGCRRCREMQEEQQRMDNP